MRANIVSYGESITGYYYFFNDINIGVNHVSSIVPVDYTLIIDEYCRFPEEKKDLIKNKPPQKKLLSIDPEFKHLYKNFKKITLCPERSNLNYIDNKNIFQNLPYSYNSPFVATCLAYRMGATEIYLHGVDFNTNTDNEVIFGNIPLNDLNIQDFKQLYKTLNNKGVRMFCSKKSKLSKFMPTHD